MDDLDFIVDAMIEASGALHVAVTDGNHVYNIIQKLDRAICKARTLKATADDMAEKTDILDCIRDRSSRVQPPPIPQQDHGQADQSPPRFSVPDSAYHNTVVVGGNPNVYAIERDADNIPTRIVHRQPTDDGFPVI
jgi:hypothetical protein